MTSFWCSRCRFDHPGECAAPPPPPAPVYDWSPAHVISLPPDPRGAAVSEHEPRLELVEHFDELHVSQCVWIKHGCCGKFGGRYILTSFHESSKLVDENLNVFSAPNFKYAPKHVCKTFYPTGELPFGTIKPNTFHVEGSCITPAEVEAREVFVEVIDLGKDVAEEEVVQRPRVKEKTS